MIKAREGCLCSGPSQVYPFNSELTNNGNESEKHRHYQDSNNSRPYRRQLPGQLVARCRQVHIATGTCPADWNRRSTPIIRTALEAAFPLASVKFY
jgi:hypothetical protein